jgi:hypothetical protein
MGVSFCSGVLVIGVALVAAVAVAPANAAIRPDPSRAVADKPPGYSNGCHLDQRSSTPKGCVYGDKKARRTITLVGDSKARQWLPMLDRYGKTRKWRIVAHTKSACSFSQADLAGPGATKRYPSCMTWNDKVLRRLKQDKPRIVVVALYKKHARKTAARTEAQRETIMVKGLRSSWRSVSRAGSRVVVLSSSPYIGSPYPGHPRWQAPDCVAAHRADPAACDVPAATALTSPSVWTAQERDRAIRGIPRVSFVDLNPRLCNAQTCRVVIGNTLVYRDNHHLTATFARSLHPHFRRLLEPTLRQGAAVGITIGQLISPS